MPRKARILAGGVCYHVINRSNERARIFHCDEDYRYFILAMLRAQGHRSLDTFGACLMPNHIHLVVRPRCDGDLGKWMQCLMTAHVRWHHERYRTAGRLWQGRYKAFPIEQDRHLLTVLRYVERNALRARLVERAEQWPWGSLAWRSSELCKVLVDSPVRMPRDWLEFVNAPHGAEELEAIRNCVNRQRPFGTDSWVDRTAAQLNLQAGLMPRGRPRIDRKVAVDSRPARNEPEAADTDATEAAEK